VETSQSSERELLTFERRVDGLLDDVGRLQRQRNRRRAGLVDAGPCDLVVEDCHVDPCILSCAVCARDHEVAIGPELFVTGAGAQRRRVVCWACGMELAPPLAAEVLAKRSDYAERGAYTLLSIAAKWLLDHVRESGNVERAERFERRCEALREARRTLKAEGYADAATWL
jgi:hypothetical protein